MAKGTSAGYAKRLVKTHEQLALTLDMPEMRIDPSEAKELEENFMIVLADRGITLRSETGNVVALIWCAMTIYGPIMLALWRKFMRDEKTSSTAATAQHQQPQQQQSNGAFYTMAPGGFPESEVQILAGGGQVAGALFRSPGDPSNIKPL